MEFDFEINLLNLDMYICEYKNLIPKIMLTTFYFKFFFGEKRRHGL